MNIRKQYSCTSQLIVTAWCNTELEADLSEYLFIIKSTACFLHTLVQLWTYLILIGHIWTHLMQWIWFMAHPGRSLSMAIFCNPLEMLHPGVGGDGTRSEGMLICMLDGFVNAPCTSLSILGNGPSLEVALWGHKWKISLKMNTYPKYLLYLCRTP